MTQKKAQEIESIRLLWNDTIWIFQFEMKISWLEMIAAFSMIYMLSCVYVKHSLVRGWRNDFFSFFSHSICVDTILISAQAPDQEANDL